MKPVPTLSTKLANWLIVTVLALVPFYAFLTVWGSALVGHYDVLRLWDSILLIVLVGITSYWLVRDMSLRKWFFSSLLIRLILAYAGLTLLLGLVSLLKGDVNPKALLYGLIVNLRFLAWFLAVILAARRSSRLGAVWPRLVIVPAMIVGVFAVLQYTLLPHDFLSHFGYQTGVTIQPIETINHNNQYIRVQSTLRGANPLGAYLVLVCVLAGALFVRGKWRVFCTVLGGVSLVALFASGSRSAWIGTLAAIVIAGMVWLPSRRSRYMFGGVLVAALLVAASAFLMLRHNVALQNHVLHTQNDSNIAISSNDAHVSAVREGLGEVVDQPFGNGPGTAGPASVYNTEQSPRIAENYYVQIAQETGWLGIALLTGIFVLVVAELYQRASKSALACALLASFVGLAIVNALSHAWVDDTIAFLWWGLAGIVLGTKPSQKADPEAI